MLLKYYSNILILEETIMWLHCRDAAIYILSASSLDQKSIHCHKREKIILRYALLYVCPRGAFFEAIPHENNTK